MYKYIANFSIKKKDSDRLTYTKIIYCYDVSVVGGNGSVL